MIITPESDRELAKQLNGEVKHLVNSLETITYYKHHYVRKTGLKKAIKQLINRRVAKELENIYHLVTDPMTNTVYVTDYKTIETIESSHFNTPKIRLEDYITKRIDQLQTTSEAE